MGDTTSGPVTEALPPAGLNSTTGQSNQNQLLTYSKTSADVNAWTITGGFLGPVVLMNQGDSVQFKSDGTNWYRVG
jgi:hypothetical protein